MDDRTLLRVGVVGALIAALCCFTPVLVVLLGAVGLSAATGYLDYVLLPALAVFLGIVGIAALRIHRQRRGPAEGIGSSPPDA